MLFRLLSSKKSVNGKTDMLSTYAKVTYEEDGLIVDKIVIDDSTVTRIDKIVKHYYGDVRYLDKFLKFNKIHSPLSANKGTVLLVPEISYLDRAVKYVNAESFNDKLRSARDRKVSNSVTNTRSILRNRGNGFTETSKTIKF